MTIFSVGTSSGQPGGETQAPFDIETSQGIEIDVRPHAAGIPLPYAGFESRTTLYTHDELAWPTNARYVPYAQREAQYLERVAARRARRHELREMWTNRGARLLCTIGSIGNAAVGYFLMTTNGIVPAELPYARGLAAAALMVAGGGFVALVFAAKEA